MTDFAKLLEGGGSRKKAIVPGQPDKSHLVALITPADGQAKMPIGAKPLSSAEIGLIRKWIVQGARDDTARYEKARYDSKRPPIYARPPVITSVDYSPDGKLLAVTGFNEVFLLSDDGSQRVGRLIGASERVQSVSFSPDGTKLAVAAGQPGRRGEIQIWDVPQRKLLRSVVLTGDTLAGASWSPDGKRIAFGCADNTVRAIDVATGQQVLQQGSHNDWVLDTVWSVDGSHLVSVGRDFTVKLTEVATQRFVDNITSITPGALKGGIEAVARHPKRDEVIVGGSDGTPRVYRIHRLTKRVIGDDSNLVREFPALKGRIFGVTVSPDGTRIAVGSSLDGKGEIGIYSYEFDTALPDAIKKIQEKVADTRTPAEKQALEKYHQDGVKLLRRVEVPLSGVYALAFRPDGRSLAAAGLDGVLRMIDVETGAIQHTASPAPITPGRDVATWLAAIPRRAEEAVEPEQLPRGAKVQALEVEPKAVGLTSQFDYSQLAVSALLEGGERVDVTRMVRARFSSPVATVSTHGLVQPRTDGQATMRLTLGTASVTVPISVSGLRTEYRVDYIRDVQPITSKLGCNQGTCHGAAKGRNGFKLSLRGYDALFDVRALADDHASRRVNVASADDSLILLKPAGGVPHAGGALFQKGDAYYNILRSWVAHGAKLNTASPRVKGITVFPQNPVVSRIGSTQQIRVVATYADGRRRDVTREAFIESGNMEVATANRSGLIRALRRGEAPMLVRYEGNYAATTLTVMGDRSGFVWKQPAAWNEIDSLVADKWRRMKIQPSELVSDAEFLRRVYLDLTGLPPTADDIRAFLADTRETRIKRDAVIDRLVGSEDYIENWTNKWADLLQVNRKFLGAEGAAAFRKWIREEVAKNTPYDQFARSILTATGSNRENPAASYYKILRDPTTTMENTTHLFLAVRFNCNKCHDHPFERWTQDQYYQMAAYFAQVDLKPDPASGDRRIGGSAVEGATPLYEVVSDRKEGEVKHERTGDRAVPTFPFPATHRTPEKASRREELAAWITSERNPLFAKSYVNRIWGYMFGVGIIEPIDDIRAGNPPTNPELLDYLTREFIRSGFDVRHLVKLICKSRTYQLSIATNRWNADDRINYSHAIARRLPAEVLFDTVHRVTGAVSKIPGMKPGTRASALPDSGIEVESGFFQTFGRPVRESACECERTGGLQLGPVMALISGPTISAAISDPENEIARLVAREPDDRRLVNELFLRILNRPATAAEINATLKAMQELEQDHTRLRAALQRREAEVAPLHARQEKDRERAIAETKAELEAYEKQIAPKVAEQERLRAERITKAEAEQQQYEATLPAKLAEWEKKQNASVQWVPLDPSALVSSPNVALTKQPDLSVIAAAGPGRGNYTFTVPTDLKGITAIRLEVLPDKALPKGGPGLAGDGNFVLSEFEVTAAPKANPEQAKKVSLQSPLADFTQAGFDLVKAIDGKVEANTGWAVYPTAGIPHWATFQTAEAIGHDGGSVLKFTLHHQYQAEGYRIGRFRISVAVASQPVGLSLSDDLKAILVIPATQRNAEQQAYLLNYLRTVDADGQQRRAAVAKAREPLPIDPKLLELRKELDIVSRPVPQDIRLAQLKQDFAMSEKQLQNRRLTAAQDVAWALINSPAFLFNH
jgi:WD40 repeat protein